MKNLMGSAAAAALMLGLSAGRAWCQHEGHGGMGGMGGMSASDPEAEAKQEARARREKLTKLQDKIQSLEDKLESPELSAKKRAGLEKKLKLLYEKKDRLLVDSHSAAAVSSGEPAVDPANEVYSCPMGDYKGPQTKDGKCPKCGMNLKSSR